MRLLLIEDEKELSSSICKFIESENYLIDTVFTFEEADEKVELYEYDCALIDIMLPDGSGLELVQKIKMLQPKCGIIIITAKNALDDKLKGFKLGTDDYLTKPFHLSELSARVNSIIRRRNFAGNNIVTIEDLSIDLDNMELHINGIQVELTSKEFELLLYFTRNKNKVLTKVAIAENLIGNKAEMMDNFNFIYTHIKNLRKKIIAASGKDRIKTVYSFGYKFVV